MKLTQKTKSIISIPNSKANKRKIQIPKYRHINTYIHHLGIIYGNRIEKKPNQVPEKLRLVVIKQIEIQETKKHNQRGKRKKENLKQT